MRNFLYNKSDILIAVIIIAVAAIIIWTRIGAIMDSSGDTGKETPTTASSTQEGDTPPAGNGEEAPPVTEPDTQGTDTEPPATESETTPAATEGADETDAAPSDEVVKFKIELGASSGSVADDLEAAGIISADDFIKEIKAQDKETKIKVGTFKLKASMSATEIVNMVTN